MEPPIDVHVAGSQLSVDFQGRVLGVNVLFDGEISVDMNGPVVGTKRSALEIPEDVGRALEAGLTRHYQPTVDVEASVRFDP